MRVCLYRLSVGLRAWMGYPQQKPEVERGEPHHRKICKKGHMGNMLRKSEHYRQPVANMSMTGCQRASPPSPTVRRMAVARRRPPGRGADAYLFCSVVRGQVRGNLRTGGAVSAGKPTHRCVVFRRTPTQGCCMDVALAVQSVYDEAHCADTPPCIRIRRPPWPRSAARTARRAGRRPPT